MGYSARIYVVWLSEETLPPYPQLVFGGGHAKQRVIRPERRGGGCLSGREALPESV